MTPRAASRAALLLGTLLWTGAAGAAETLSGDARGRADVRFVEHDGIQVQVYSDGSYWLTFSDNRESLYLKTNGAAIRFDADGTVLSSEGHWKAPAEIGNVKGLSPEKLSRARAAVLYARSAEGSARLVGREEAFREEAPPGAATPRAASDTVIDWGNSG